MREDKLIRRLEQGDASAVDELIEMYYPEIFRYCIWHVPNRSLAEDATQETFLKVIRYIDRYAHKGKFRSFLYKIASNTCIDLWRKNKAADELFEEMPEDISYWETGYENAHSMVDLKRYISVLPKEQQEIVILRYGHDLTIREISEITGVPLRTVQSRIRSALKKLKKTTRKEGIYEKCKNRN